jgi:Na+-transporting NADH:ubiquinone oxidoreductase subunit NqrB
MSVNVADERIRYYLKLALGSIAFFFFLYYTYIEVTNPALVVDRWIFLMLLAVMGALLGVDIFEQYRSSGGGGG